ncbi:MAG: tetratricopeptide repeat protein, partial [Bradyrhizobium sp.]|nr:tetratricopeptide repeat protein [Bradyrhizobium sp.]
MADPAPELLMQQAVSAQRRGALPEARLLYERLLRLDPRNAVACGNLAIIAAQQGDLAGAERLFREGIRLRPDYPAGHNHLGTVLQQQGRWKEAIAAHAQAIELDPNYAEAHLALGNALKQQGDLDRAMRCYLAALSIRPTYAEAHNNTGIVLQMRGDLDEAVDSYRRAIAARPGYAEALFNLGSVQHQMGALEAAEASYRQVISLAPTIAVAHNNLGTVLKDKNDLDAALAALEQAIALQANYAEAHYNRGTVLQQQARAEDALVAYDRAIALRPDYIDAANNAGIVLQELGRYTDAIELYRKVGTSAHADINNNMGTALLASGRPEEARQAFEQALVNRPDFPEAAYNLGNALRELGRLADAIAAWQQALQLRADYPDALSQLVYHRALACEWEHHAADQERLIGMVRSGIRVPPFYLFATPATAADQWRAARQWMAPIQPPREGRYGHQPPLPGVRLRLGYLSGDFHQHATAQLTAGLFEGHDRNCFEVFAYSYGAHDGSAMRARLTRAFDRFVDISALSYRDAAKAIYQDRIEILIDLKGYTHGSRPLIPALRPAPIQVSYLGYPATMGADFIDYILVDRFVVGEADQAVFSEKLVHLPVCYQANDPAFAIAASATSRRDWGLPEEGLVLCCFNNSYKLSPAMFDIWMRLLAATSGSVLWLLGTNKLVETNLRKETAARGLDPARLVFADVVPWAAHIERHRHADLFLDTLPCNAHTTASDALWGGVPVLTCRGDTFAGRVAGSLMNAIGMGELVTSSLREYEQTARALLDDPARLAAMRRKIEQKR